MTIAAVPPADADPAGVDVGTVDLSDRDWWTTPPGYRHAAFDLLRRERPFAFFAEPDIPGFPEGPGYHAVTRYADLEAISSQPAVFCSGRGAVSMQDLPTELNEFYGSLISMDDPRHAKIRRIVSKTFTPRMLERTLDSVRAVVDDVLARARATAARSTASRSEPSASAAMVTGRLPRRNGHR